jgi:hypothetical protein
VDLVNTKTRQPVPHCTEVEVVVAPPQPVLHKPMSLYACLSFDLTFLRPIRARCGALPWKSATRPNRWLAPSVDRKRTFRTTDLSDNDGTIRNDGEMNGSNAEDKPDKIANGGSSGGNGSGGEFIRDDTSNAMERPVLADVHLGYGSSRYLCLNSSSLCTWVSDVDIGEMCLGVQCSRYWWRVERVRGNTYGHRTVPSANVCVTN